MRIRVDEIPESGRVLRFHWDEERLSQFLPPEDPYAIRLVHPLNVVLELNRRPDHVRVQGTITGELEVVCHRCLGAFRMPIRETVDVFLLEEKQAPEEDETELESEEMEFEFFDGEIIDIDQMVAEQVFLSLPYKVLCSENCKGLCPRCGANLNTESCDCDKTGKGSAFAGLASLKSRLPQSKEDEEAAGE